jgi:hypothetical protein
MNHFAMDIQRFGRRFESSGPKPSTNHLSALPVTETTPREILARDTGADRQLTQSSHSRPAWSMLLASNKAEQ